MSQTNGFIIPNFRASDLYPAFFRNTTPTTTEEATNAVPAQSGTKPTHMLIGIIVLLVLIRVVYEVAPRGE